MEKYLTFFKAHEKLVLIGITILAALAITANVLNVWEKHDQKVYDAKHATELADAQRNAEIEKNNAVLAQQAAEQAVLLQQLRDKLDLAMSQRQAATQQQQTKDAALPPSDLALRWEQIENLSLGSINAEPNGLLVSQAAALKTVQDLEEVKTLQADLDALRQELTADDAVATALKNQVTGLQTEVAWLQKELTDTKTADQAELNLVKAQARRSKLKIVVIAYTAGLLTRDITKALGF